MPNYEIEIEILDEDIDVEVIMDGGLSAREYAIQAAHAEGMARQYAINAANSADSAASSAIAAQGIVTSFDAYYEEKKALLKGDKGDPFTYDDFTTEQLASLKGATGNAGVFIGDTEPTDLAIKVWIDTNEESPEGDLSIENLPSMEGGTF